MQSLVLLLCLSAACSQTAAPVPPQPGTDGADRSTIPAQAFPSGLAGLQLAIEERLADEPGSYGIAIIDIETGRSLGVNDRLEFHAASTMKVPVLLELYRRASAGEIDLDQAVTVTNAFRSIADGSTYAIVAGDDSDTTLHGRIGSTATLRELARLMTVRSSNLATNILIDQLDATQIQKTALRVGGTGVTVLRGVEDGPAYRAGMNNRTTARGMARVLASIARCDILARAECTGIRDVLAAQEFDEMIPAGLPAGTRVAHKTGWITGIQHDAAIVLPDASPPFVLVVLSQGAADTLAPRHVAADIARLGWAALGPGGTLRPRWPGRTAELLELHRTWRVPAFPEPTLRYDEVWSALSPIIEAAPAISVEGVGRSVQGRAINLVRFGDGPVRVLFWSQMHGDETTATRALVDLFNYIAGADDERVRRWRERLTVLAVPMLNPDGAELHRRRNMSGIDVNRDARVLATPEGRTLKAVQQRWQPQFGFNLHDQNPRSRVGPSSRLAAMALLAPRPDAEGTPSPSYERARQLTGHLAGALGPLTGDHLTQYDDSYNARAFGDGMQTWGVSTVLIESGGWRGDESKHYLRTTNFAALVSALDAIANDELARADVAHYTSLPMNGRAVNDLLISGGRIVLEGAEPYRADIAINAPAVGGPSRFDVADVGDLTGVEARDTVDASGLYIHPAQSTADALQDGALTEVFVSTTADRSGEVVAVVRGITVTYYRAAVRRPPGSVR